MLNIKKQLASLVPELKEAVVNLGTVEEYYNWAGLFI
jgi:hypothetical protein